MSVNGFGEVGGQAKRLMSRGAVAAPAGAISTAVASKAANAARPPLDRNTRMTDLPALPLAAKVSPTVRGLHWNFADVWDVVATRVPDAPALVHESDVVWWSAFEARAAGVAAALVEAGLTR